MARSPDNRLVAQGLTLAFGERIIQRNLSFSVRRGSIFAIMGGSGCGKSTLLRSLIGLLRPVSGTVLVDNEDYWSASDARRNEMSRRFGIVFQNGALWSSMTIRDNVALPLQMFTRLDAAAVDDLVRLKLSLVGLGRAADTMPSELSGGMRKRAGIARALALDPDTLFFDEPSAGLDPVTSKRLDDLILDLRDGLGATIVIVSHELASLFGICDDGIFLDAVTRTSIAHGAPGTLRDACNDATVRAFMHRERPQAPNAQGVRDG